MTNTPKEYAVDALGCIAAWKHAMEPSDLESVSQVIREAMAHAWEEGLTSKCDPEGSEINPYK